MQGWLYGSGLIYLAVNISANKISLPQGEGYTLHLKLCRYAVMSMFLCCYV